MDNISNDRNPLYPNALNFYDVKKGVKFQIFNALNGQQRGGKFLGEPILITKEIGSAKVRCKISTGILKSYETELFLTDCGIIPIAPGLWNLVNVTIPKNKSCIERYWDWVNNEGREIISAAANIQRLVNNIVDELDELDEFVECEL